jgi:ABC-2 type transport system permease protein
MTTITHDITTRSTTRSTRDDLDAVPQALRSEWIKLSSLRANKVILVVAAAVNGLAAWSVATFVTDEVLTVSEVFVYPAVLTAALAAIAAILVFTSEAQHGTLAGSLAAQPTRWVLAASKTATAAVIGVVLGAVGMIGGVAGATLGGLERGDTSAMAITALWAMFFTSMASLIGLGLGMIVRHSAGAISGLLVWWFVVENLVRPIAPPNVGRFLPFDAGYRLLEVGSDFDTPAILAVAFTRPQLALVFSGYAAVAMIVGTVLLSRRDTD